VPVGHQRDRGDLGHVARVDHRDAALADWRGEEPLAAHRLGQRQQVGHGVGRLEDDGGKAGRLQVALVAALLIGEGQRRPHPGAGHRELDDPPHAGGRRRVDHGGLVLDVTRMVGTGEEHRVGAFERARHGRRVAEVAGRQLDLVAETGGRRRGVADEGAHGQTAVAQGTDDVRADVAGGSGDEDHAPPPWLGAGWMLWFSRNRFVGS
jgi:hypothetical protein